MVGKPGQLSFPGLVDPFSDATGRFTVGTAAEVPVRYLRHLDVQIDPVEQRTRNPGHVLVYPGGRTGAFAARIAEVSAWTRVHGGDHRESRGIGQGPGDAGQVDLAVFQGLPEHFQHMLPEFGQLVQKKHAVVGERHLSGFRNAPAADQARFRDGLVRRPEGPGGDQGGKGRYFPRYTVNLRRFQRFLQGEIGQYGRHAAGEQRLARTRWTDEQQIV